MIETEIQKEKKKCTAVHEKPWGKDLRERLNAALKRVHIIILAYY